MFDSLPTSTNLDPFMSVKIEISCPMIYFVEDCNQDLVFGSSNIIWDSQANRAGSWIIATTEKSQTISSWISPDLDVAEIVCRPTLFSGHISLLQKKRRRERGKF